MGSTLLQDQKILDELKAILPSSLQQNRLHSVQSYLEILKEELSEIIDDKQKVEVLELVLKIGTDICYSHEVAVLCLLVLANFGSEQQINKFVSCKNVERRLRKALESNDDKINKSEILEALKRIVTDDDISNVIANSSMLEWFLHTVKEGENKEIQQKAREVLVALTMSESNKEILNSNKQFKGIFPKHKLSLGEILATRRCAEIWRRNSATKIEDKHKQLKEKEQESKRQHVMISYSWKNDDIAVALKSLLDSKKINTWIDRSGVALNMMEEIAEAVENSSHFLALFSSHYKQSVYCKMEAKYAIELQKPIIPIHVEEGFTPSGWIAMVTSGLRYHELYHANDVTLDNCRSLIHLLTG